MTSRKRPHVSLHRILKLSQTYTAHVIRENAEAALSCRRGKRNFTDRNESWVLFSC